MKDVKAKTAELTSLQRRYQHIELKDGKAENADLIDTDPLSMALNSAVDTGLAGGIPLYRRAFFDPDFIARNTDKIDLVEGLRVAIDQQVKTSTQSSLPHAHHCS